MIQPPIGKGGNSIFQSISLKDIRLGYTFYHIFSLFMFKKAIFFNISLNEYIAIISLSYVFRLSRFKWNYSQIYDTILTINKIA